MKKRKPFFTITGEELIKEKLFMAAVAFGLVLAAFLVLIIVGVVKAFLL